MTYRTQFHQALVIVEVDELGNRLNPTANPSLIHELTDIYYDSYDVDIRIEKSITSNLDTATITIHNHPILEQMYDQKKAFFDNMNEKFYEVDIFQYYHCNTDNEVTRERNQCIFTGDLVDLSVTESSEITDQALNLSLVAGQRASLRTIVNKAYTSAQIYDNVIADLLDQFTGYDLTVVDDPFNKLFKNLPKTRTVHKKVSEVLDDICRDLEMTWGFDAARYNINTTTSGYLKSKGLYFVDKASVFDSLPSEDPADFNNGVGPHELAASTGKIGRIGYAKSQFTLTHLTDPALNIGRSVRASDYGTLNAASDLNTGDAFFGRINRMSINNNTTYIECTYIDEDGNAIIENDKKNSGSLIL